MKQPEVPISKGLLRQMLVVHCWNNSQQWKRNTISSRDSEESQRQAIQPIPLHGCLSMMQVWKQGDESESASQVRWKALIQPFETITPKRWWKKIRCPAAVIWIRDTISLFRVPVLRFLSRDIAFTFTAGYLDFMILLFGNLDFIDPCAMLFVCTVC